MWCPDTYPTVLNGKIYYNDSNTVEYECMTGFYMSGNKRITCTAGVWETAPTCNVIRQYDDVDVDVFPDWWLYVLTVILVLLVLACFLCILLYFCCCRGDNVVYPYGRGNSAGCCGKGSGCSCCGQRRTTVVEDDEEREYSGVYFVPVRSTPTQGRYIVVNAAARKTRSTSTEEEVKTKKKTKNAATSTEQNDPSHRTTGNGGLYSTAGHTMSNGTPRASDGYAWSDRGARPSDSKAWKDSSNFETHSDGDLISDQPRVKKPAKEVRAWLPHSHPVRNINTSTK